MLICRQLPILLVLGCLATSLQTVAAQQDTASVPAALQAVLPPLGGIADERLRLQQLLGTAPAAGYLIRSASTLQPFSDHTERRAFAVVPPQLVVVNNSALPADGNDGELWAGRGWNSRLRAGFRARHGPVELTLVPEVALSQNRTYPVLLSETAATSAFVPSWYTDSISIDLPLRFGTEPLRRLSPGQTSLTIRAGGAAFGASNEEQWWGPGVRNGIVLSNNAPGIPRLFLRTDGPVSTALGDIEAMWMTGTLTESLFFDADEANDLRSITAFALTYRPLREPNLTIGLARAVYQPTAGFGETLDDALAVVTYWRAKARTDSAEARHPEQILSLFVRWIFPAAGTEVYAEWARTELPRSFRDLLVAPNHSQGYTLGMQWARTAASLGGIVKLQGELTYLEQSAAFRERPGPGFYASTVVPQGYTHRGQAVGAAIGPGASSQWLAADFLADRWQIGAFADRTRWDNDAFYRQATGGSFLAHDVSLGGGLRGAWRSRWGDIALRVSRSKRYNYLFQNPLTGFGDAGEDILNTTWEMSVVPHS